MKSPLLTVSTFVAMALCLPTFAQAGQVAPKKGKPQHHHSVISAVSADSITVQAASTSKTYKITPNTEITFKGEAAKVDALQVGMRVSVTPDAADEGSAALISANDAPTPEPTPRGKK